MWKPHDLTPRPPPLQAELKLYRYRLLIHSLRVWGEAPASVTFSIVSKISHPTLTCVAECNKDYNIIRSEM